MDWLTPSSCSELRTLHSHLVMLASSVSLLLLTTCPEHPAPGHATTTDFELVVVVLRLALDALSLPYHGFSSPGSFASCSYLLLLLYMRRRTTSARWHSSALYAFRWVMSATALLLSFAPLPQPSLNGLYETTAFFLECALLVIAARTPASTTTIRKSPQEPHSKKQVTVWDLATFSWLDQLVWMGHKKPLQVQHVWRLDPEDTAAATVRRFSQLSSPRLFTWKLLRFFRTDLIVQALWAWLLSVTTFMPTILLRTVLQYLGEAETTTTRNAAWLYVLLMFASECISAVADGQMIWVGQKISLRLRSIIISEVYAKAMRRRATADASVSDATMFNLVAVDAFKIAGAGAAAHEIWVSTLQIIISLILLYYVLGLSFLVAAVIMAVTFRINMIMATRVCKAQMNVMGCADLRIRGTAQFLRSIRTIKLFAWEQKFMGKLEKERSTELEALKSRFVLWSISATICYVVPFLITFLSFAVYTTVAGKELLPSVAFSALSLFNLLKAPLDRFVGMLARIQDFRGSINRVQAFLRDEEAGKCEQTDSSSPNFDIILKEASFAWTPAAVILQKITASFRPNKLNVIAGPIGSGKTSLLLALLGEMSLLDGTFRGPSGAVAYCAQETWLIDASIRDNILFAQPWEPERYNDVIKACALDIDVKALDAGDLTLVGDCGTLLSGGQKQRLALARAVYSRSSYLLIDDCLSAVDSHTARRIFDHCLTGPLMKDRTCILATHNVALVLPRCAYIVLLEGGMVKYSGTPCEVEISKVLGKHSFSHHSNRQRTERKLNRHREEDAIHRSVEKTNDSETETTAAESNTSRRVSWRIVAMYTGAMGTWKLWVLLAFFFISQQMISIFTTWWIKDFSNAYVKQPVKPTQGDVTVGLHQDGLPAKPTANIGYYLGVYGLILCCCVITSFFRTLLASNGSLAASRVLHHKLLTSVSQATLSYFDRTPPSWLLDRFSKDIQICDLEIVPIALGTAHFTFSLLSKVILIASATPAFLLFSVPISLVYLAIGKLYIDSSRDLKRLEVRQRGPLYQHFLESISGTITIRAFRNERTFMQQHLAKLDALNAPSLYLNGVDCWLALRLNLTSALVTLLASYFAIMSKKGQADASAAGLSLTQAMTHSKYVLWFIRYYALSERSFTSLESIHTCLAADQEAPADLATDSLLLPPAWPHRGAVVFEHYSTTYRPDLDVPVLKNITFRIRPLEKIGVVGRTGAGKSSLIRALFRRLEASHGRILIDGIDISTVGLRRLRQAIVVVSQDATLFASTVRSNLDPLDEFSDAEIRDALRRVRLTTWLRAADDGRKEGRLRSPADNTADDERIQQKAADFDDLLSFQLTESGANLSDGQRQLLCLARAILRAAAPRILVLDEATASVDADTDRAVQQAIAQVRATTITIAHRLRTVIDYDKILVLDRGEVKEFGHPWELLVRKRGVFRDMCRADGDWHVLEGLARKAWERAKEGGGS